MPSPPGTTIRIRIRVAFIIQLVLGLVTRFRPRPGKVVTRPELRVSKTGRKGGKREGRKEEITYQSRDAVRVGEWSELPLLSSSLLVDEKSLKLFRQRNFVSSHSDTQNRQTERSFMDISKSLKITMGRVNAI